MSNKKRKSDRSQKTPVSSLSSKRIGNVSAVTVNEIRVNGSGETEELGDKSKGKSSIVQDSTIVNEVNDSDMLKASTPTVSNNVVAEALNTVKENASEMDGNTDKNNVENVDKPELTEKSGKHTYANMVKNDMNNVNKNLIFIAPKLSEEGIETVVFDEEIVNKGSVKWQNTICGYLVGHNMMIGELRYHIRRMWSRFGLREIIANNSGVNLFKFKDEESMQHVLDQGPWMVYSRPMFVMKWDPGMGMQKVEPTKLPVWVKLLAIPMEAWSMEGMSALSSCLGKPIMMDDMTAKMCQFGIGKTDFARILVELDAKKVIKDSIRIEYTNKDASIKGTKEVKVVYDWKPEICTYCNVFGHCDGKCNKRPKSEEEIKASKEAEKVNKQENEEKKQQWKQQTKKYGYGNNYYRQEYRKKKMPNNVVRVQIIGIRI